MKKLAGFERKIALQALLYMLYMASSKDSRVGLSDMCAWTGCTKPTVIKHLRGLEALGLVAREERSHRPNAKAFEYYVTDVTEKSKALRASKHSYSVLTINILKISE